MLGIFLNVTNDTITLEQAFPYIWVAYGILGLAFGISYMLSRKKIFYILEFAIVFLLAFIVYDPQKGNFNDVIYIGLTTIVAYGIGFGIVYFIKSRKGTLKEEENLNKDSK